MRRVLSVALSLAVFALVGCGNTAPVSGTITMAGKPLPYANIIFNPTAGESPGPGSSAMADENGKYILQVNNGSGPGARIGPHKVVITAYEGGKEIPSSGPGGAFRKQLVADEFNIATTLTFTVPASGTDKADFDVQPAGKKAKK